MRFQLPNPRHGWREFAGEVGIIVLGVLIALGAQQLVESWQWRQEVRTERGSLIQEVRDSIGKLAFSDAFSGFDGWDRAMQREREVWLRLTPLNSADLLTEEDWSGLRLADAPAADTNEAVRLGGAFTIKHVGGELPGVNSPAGSPAGVPLPDLKPVQSFINQICDPLLAPSGPRKPAQDDVARLQ